MNEFSYSIIVICVVCALSEAFVPKEHNQIRTLIGLFAIMGIIVSFGLFEGFKPLEISTAEYENRADYAIKKAYEKEINKLSAPFGLTVTDLVLDGEKVVEIRMKGEKNPELEEKLNAVFGGKCIFG